VLLLASFGTLILAMAILLPVINRVNNTRMKVLCLFVDIPNHHVFALSSKCEKFLMNFHEEVEDELQSEDNNGIQVDDSDVTS